MTKTEIEDAIRNFTFVPTKQKEQIPKLLWDYAKDCYLEEKFIATVILAGIATEFAHKIKLEEYGKKIKNGMI